MAIHLPDDRQTVRLVTNSTEYSSSSLSSANQIISPESPAIHVSRRRRRRRRTWMQELLSPTTRVVITEATTHLGLDRNNPPPGPTVRRVQVEFMSSMHDTSSFDMLFEQLYGILDEVLNNFPEQIESDNEIENVSRELFEEKIVKNLKTRTLHQNNEFDICVICQEEYEKEETIGSLLCGHEFHAHCIKKWLLVKNACPICKAPAFPPE